MLSVSIMDPVDVEAGGGSGSGGGGGGATAIPLSLLTSVKPSEIPRVRLLVLGDSGVGKTVLAARMAGATWADATAAANLPTTTGVNTEVRLLQTNRRTHAGHQQHQQQAHHAPLLHGSSLQHRSNSLVNSPSSAAAAASSASSLVFLELWDVCGHRRFAASRDVFYSGVHGCIFVFDLCNRKSYENIRKWIKELVRVDRERGIEDHPGFDTAAAQQPGHQRSTSRPTSTSSAHSSPHQSPAIRPAPAPSQLGGSAGASSAGHATAGSSGLSHSLGSLPVLIIGNKLDEYRARQAEQGVYEAVKDYGIDSIYLSALDPKADLSTLDRFYDQVISRRFSRDAASASASATTSSSGRSSNYSSPSQPQSMSSQLHDLSQVGAGVSSRRMAPFAPAPRSAGPGSSGPTFERRMSGQPDWQQQQQGYGGGSSGSQSLHPPPSFSGFSPPPIRTLADFAIDVGGSPSDQSPTVLSPSTALPSYSNFGDRPMYPLPSAALGDHAHSLPPNTALHVLTQQHQRYDRQR